MPSKTEDQRLNQEERCRVTTMVGPHEFICILKAHAAVYQRKTKRSRDAYAAFVSDNPVSNRHYFVRRYPMGDH